MDNHITIGLKEVTEDFNKDQTIQIIKIIAHSNMGEVIISITNYQLQQEARPFNTLNMPQSGYKKNKGNFTSCFVGKTVLSKMHVVDIIKDNQYLKASKLQVKIFS